MNFIQIGLPRLTLSMTVKVEKQLRADYKVYRKIEFVSMESLATTKQALDFSKDC